jgi:hypothetical protein
VITVKKLGRIWKKVAIQCSKEPSKNFPERKTTKHVSQEE